MHPGDSDPIIPASAWERPGRDKDNSTSSLLSIFSRIVNDPEIYSPTAADQLEIYGKTVHQFNTHILKHTNAWSFDASSGGELSRALEEIAWVATIMYAVCGFNGNDVDAFNADFFW
jgi:hypothetical protein